MLHLARVELLLFNQTNKDSSKALDNAQDLLCNATRFEITKLLLLIYYIIVLYIFYIN